MFSQFNEFTADDLIANMFNKKPIGASFIVKTVLDNNKELPTIVKGIYQHVGDGNYIHVGGLDIYRVKDLDGALLTTETIVDSVFSEAEPTFQFLAYPRQAGRN